MRGISMVVSHLGKTSRRHRWAQPSKQKILKTRKQRREERKNEGRGGGGCLHGRPGLSVPVRLGQHTGVWMYQLAAVAPFCERSSVALTMGVHPPSASSMSSMRNKIYSPKGAEVRGRKAVGGPASVSCLSSTANCLGKAVALHSKTCLLELAHTLASWGQLSGYAGWLSGQDARWQVGLQGGRKEKGKTPQMAGNQLHGTYNIRLASFGRHGRWRQWLALGWRRGGRRGRPWRWRWQRLLAARH